MLNNLLWSPTLSADIEPMPIAITRGEWLDENRQKDKGGRKVPYKIYCPLDHDKGPFPVIIWSHGLGGSRDGAGFISRYVASHGYVVIHIQHGGSDSGLWEGKPGHPWDVIRTTHIPRSATLQRLKDVPFALSQLKYLDIAPVMDFNRMGMSGHSFGGMTTQVMAGQRRGYGHREYTLFQKEFIAGIVYSPNPYLKRKERSRENAYGGIQIPLLMMTGTVDDSPLHDFGVKERVNVFNYSGGPEQHLLMLDQGDHMVYNGSRGKLDANPKRDIHEEIIKILSVTFWDAYLKGDQTAKNWLTHDGVQKWLETEATYEFREKPIA